MFTRTSDRVLRWSVMLAVPLAGCGGHRSEQVVAPKGTTILCAQGGADFTRTCTIEGTQTSEGLALTVRHQDGAFRRLLVPLDGRGVVAADGAEPAVVRVLDAATVEVALGRDRYRLPVTIKGARLAA